MDATRTDYTHGDLIKICEQAFTAESNWIDRDSAGAHRQLGECYALLRAGCDFTILRGSGLSTNDRTIWIEVRCRGFAHFDYGGADDVETYYLPTAARLESAGEGKDWY